MAKSKKPLNNGLQKDVTLEFLRGMRYFSALDLLQKGDTNN